MNNSTKMNMFLQRMLRKSDDELNVQTEDKDFIRADSPKGGLGKTGWIKKLGTYSPSKYKVPSSPMRTSPMRTSPMRTSLDHQSSFSRSSDYVCGTPKKSCGSPHTPLEMPDLESIIREFEMGFLSPTKHEATKQANPAKQRNFVKKIVAAFEVKYNAYSDQKAEQDASELEDERKDRSDSLHFTDLTSSPKGRSAIFSSFKSGQDEWKSDGPVTPAKCNQTEIISGERWPSTLFSPASTNSLGTKSPKKCGIFSSPFNRSASKDAGKHVYMNSMVTVERQETQCTNTTIDDASFLKFEREDSIFASRAIETYSDGFALDETKSISSLDLDVTLPEPEETSCPSPSSSLNRRFLSSNLSENPGTPLKSSSVIDRTPKIVGAFLKKPIEIEDTSIDWIPITGKKLPRKKSLKKLLSVLTGRKSSYEKKQKALFSSERNLNEDTRELQDSGYDERSCSSSSLTSLISISEALLHQENTYIEPERRTTLRTFRSRNSMDQDEDEDEAFAETYCSRRGKKRLLLTEVPREEVKLDLGPTFPSSTKMLTMSLDRRAHCKPKNRTPSPKYLPMLPKHPFSARIPKHPFVSMTKMDEVVEENGNRLESPSIIIRNDLYEVEFRRSCNDIPSPASARSSMSFESEYDVPRRFISKSESRIPDLCARASRRRRNNEPVYDVPRSQHPERPKSSIYEDAVSLKRRTADFPSTYVSAYYSTAENTEPHYATVKPRSRRIYLSQEMLSLHEKRSPF